MQHQMNTQTRHAAAAEISCFFKQVPDGDHITSTLQKCNV